MNLFGIGPAELIVILLIAVLVFGPDKVPEAARKAGRWYADFRRITQDMTTQVTRQLDVEIADEERAKQAREVSATVKGSGVIEGEVVASGQDIADTAASDAGSQTPKADA